MKKFLKKFIKITAIVLIVLILTIVLVPIIFKGKIMDMVKEEANKSLNAKLEFADMKLSLIKNFPNVTAELKDMTIVGVDTFATDTLVSFKSFKATLDLMSVVSGDEIKVKKLYLVEPDIKVIILKDGRANYDIAKEDTTAVPENPAEADTTSNFKLNLKEFKIVKGNVIYDDRSSDIYALMENLNLDLSGDMTEDITDLDLNMTVDSLTAAYEGVNYLSKVKTVFDSKLKADLAKWIFTLGRYHDGYDV
jgi:uncharacterized protein involved in outer membrane biogenesis